MSDPTSGKATEGLEFDALTVLYQIARALAGGGPLDAVLTKVLSVLADRAGMARGMVSIVNTWNDEVFMQGRLDLIGIVYRWGHLLFEVDLPSIRFHSVFQHLGIWGWMFNLSVSYVI